VKLQTSPAVILIPSRMDEVFVNSLQPSLVEEYTLSVRPGNEFSFENGKKKVLKLAEVLPYAGRMSMELPDDMVGGDQSKLVRMGGVVEWNKQISVNPSRCADIDWLCRGIDNVSLQARGIELR
jgi:hypothetical protein